MFYSKKYIKRTKIRNTSELKIETWLNFKKCLIMQSLVNLLIPINWVSLHKIQVIILTDLKLKMALRSRFLYSRQKPLKYKFKRSRVLPKGVDFIWTFDLVDLTNIKKCNNGIQLWLVVIDVFPRYTWVQPQPVKPTKVVLKDLKTV